MIARLPLRDNFAISNRLVKNIYRATPSMQIMEFALFPAVTFKDIIRTESI
jgi:hypothetical protein